MNQYLHVTFGILVKYCYTHFNVNIRYKNGVKKVNLLYMDSI